MEASVKSLSIPYDFPDWLSPMVVKEVRQGLRGWLFVSLFLVLHLCLLSWGCLTVASNSTGDSDGFFWLMLIIGMMVIVSRGTFAIQSEKSGNTLELLQISNLTAFRMVAGKWTALMVQVVLFISSLLPYGLLRYYFGAFSAGRDGKAFLLIITLAAVFAALVVYLSCLKKWVAWPVLLTVCGLIVAMISDRVRIDGIPWPFVIGFSGLALLYIPFFILMGASSFAASSENLATSKRVLGLLSLLPVAICYALVGSSRDTVSVLIVCSAPLLLLAMSDALTEQSAVTPFAVRNFRRFGWLGKLCAVFLAPNRAAGFFYTVGVGLLVGIAGCLVCYSEIKTQVQLISALKGFCSFLLAAGAIIYLASSLSALIMRRRPEATAYFYWFCIGVQIAAGVILVSVAANFADEEDRPFWQEVALISPIGCFAAMTKMYRYSSSTVNAWLADYAVMAAILQWLLVLGLISCTVFKEAKNLRRLLHNERTDNRS